MEKIFLGLSSALFIVSSVPVVDGMSKMESELLVNNYHSQKRTRELSPSTSDEDSIDIEISEDYRDSSDESVASHESDTITSAYDEYCEGGFYVWEAAAERFLQASFIEEFSRTGVAPVLNDGKLEFDDFVKCTLIGNVFLEDWDAGSRSAAAKFT